jgi:hypothetical protein
MFMDKIQKMSEELGKTVQELQDVARESLLYGMKLNRTPSNLKRALKKVNYDSKLATQMWRGNAYLLLTFPKILTDRKAKIVNLQDYLFARQILKDEHYTELKKRIDNIPTDISIPQILQSVIPAIRYQTRRGRFLPQFDSMHADMKDIQQDISEIAIAIVNFQFTNFKTHASEDINKYISYCIGHKSKTYFRSKAPKAITIKLDDQQEFDKIMDQEPTDFDPLHTIEFKEDMAGMLPRAQYEAVMLFLDMADQELHKRFDVFLARYGKTKESLTQPLLKKYIEKFLNVNVFSTLQKNKKLLCYLTNYSGG